MKFAYYIIVIPVIALIVWVLYGIGTSEEGIFFAQWPQDCISPQVVLVISLAVGYLLGKLNSWFNYLPLRQDLKQQKKNNRVLNIEQEKLCHTVDDLKQNIAGLREKVAANPETPVIRESKQSTVFVFGLKEIFGRFFAKKGN